MYLTELFEENLNEKIEVGDLRRKAFYAVSKVVNQFCRKGLLSKNLTDFLRRIKYRLSKGNDLPEEDDIARTDPFAEISRDITLDYAITEKEKEVLKRLHDCLYPLLKEVVEYYNNKLFLNYRCFLIIKRNTIPATEGSFSFSEQRIYLNIDLMPLWLELLSKKICKPESNYIVNDIVEVFIHEMIHLEQFFRRGTKRVSEKKIKVRGPVYADFIRYMVSKAEIEPRASDIAQSLIQLDYSKEEIKEMLKTTEGIFKLSKFTSTLSNYYTDYLRSLHPKVARSLWIRLIKKIIHYLDQYEKEPNVGEQ